MAIALLTLYAIMLTFILCYSFMQINLVILYLKNRKRLIKEQEKVAALSDEEKPLVTIQLPVFNELYVIERLLDHVGAIDYPKDKLEIQVLDDSTDESFDIAAKKIKEIQQNGIDIKHIKRPERVGYKAGALKYGTAIAKGEFIAIFDADFIPDKDFLNRTLPYFNDPKTGLVQSKWEHLNRNYSLLTQLQAFGLDAHFTVEQVGRNSGGHFINFNGTAGIWRKTCIESAGGWESDTLTEDLDLSYRAQLKNWKFKYLENLGSPAELPVEMNALKAQQFRWTKGAAECTRKNLNRVLKADNVNRSTKLNAIFHLMNSFLFVCIMMIGILSIPVMFVNLMHPEIRFLFDYSTVFYLGMIFLIVFYFVTWVSERGLTFLNVLKFLYLFPAFLSVSMGLSVYNSIGVIEGYIGKKSAFVRTPKFAIKGKKGSFKDKKYINSGAEIVSVIEGLLFFYFAWGLYLAIRHKMLPSVPYFLMLMFGFGFVFFLSKRHLLKS